mmetsp:Transcript_2048/g.2137  ORF Transcript_2048/g.2137 Transcript_2048/m.2137 type:complete len:217 (-) Transcript_2048:154-804(-)
MASIEGNLKVGSEQLDEQDFEDDEDLQQTSSVTSYLEHETSEKQDPKLNHPESSITSGTSSSSNALHAWIDIFATSKLVLSVAPRNLQNPHIMIQHAQGKFLLNFGFGEDQLPLPLSKLFGNTSERAKIARLQQCMLTGRSFSEFMNLHKSNGGSLSCYVSLLCLTNQRSTQEQNQQRVTEGSTATVKYGILTIRSASVVGNSKYSGAGMMGAHSS